MDNKIEVSKMFNLVDSISYADNSVVSKTILKKQTGNITLFAFDKGEGLAEHTTPHEALLLVIDGEAEITIGGNPNNVKADQAIILPAGVPHSVKGKEKFKMMLIMIKS